MHDEARTADRNLDGGGQSFTETKGQEPLSTARLAARHRVSDFVSVRSARVQSFIRDGAVKLERQNYCRVFVFENPDDRDCVWGYYTLTSALLHRSEITTQHQKKVPPGLPVPLVRIGYMGRDDTAPPGLGAALIVDAARRVFRNDDIASWGLILDAEQANQKLMAWYGQLGFKQAQTQTGVMYAPFKSLIPELN